MDCIFKNTLSIVMLMASLCSISIYSMDDHKSAVSADDSARVEKLLELERAARADDGTRVKELIKELIKIDAVNIKDAFGKTPLHVLAFYGYQELVQDLINAGADVNGQDNDGYTPLLVAANGGYHEIVQNLIDAGAKVNMQERSGCTPLHFAASSCHHQRIVKTLIGAGADVNRRNKMGRTPLHDAAANGQVVQQLLAAGANVNMQDNGGETPLHVAAFYGNLAVVKAFIAEGADVNMPNKNGMTPSQLATRNNRTEMVELIKRVNDASDNAKKQTLALLCSMHPRLGADSPARLVEENQRDGVFNIIGNLVKQTAVADVALPQEPLFKAILAEKVHAEKHLTHRCIIA